jgi:sulfide:quinone oxidoreductase
MTGRRTVILGGGFGGLATANALRRALPTAHEVVVIDRSPRFYVGAGKTWIMLGARRFDEISQSRAALLEPGIRLVEAPIDRIDVASRVVSAGSDTIRWDYLVVALGADVNPARVPGLAEAAHTFYTVEGAERLRDDLARFEQGDVVLLVAGVPFKCPPAPYEAVMLLHDAFSRRGLTGQVRFSMYTAEGAPMTTAGPAMGQFIRGELEARGIAYYPLKTATGVDGGKRRVTFADGSEATYDLLIAVPPHEVPEVVRAAGLAGPSGWIPVDPRTLQVKQPAGLEGVYAIGDVTSVPLPGRYKPDVGLALPKAGVFAEAQGRVVAQRIAGEILGRPSDAAFDGRGFCYLETGGDRAVKAEGAFFELPVPAMRKQAPDEAQLEDKRAWVNDHLRAVRTP